MKKEIHPEYYQAKVTCGGCGTTYTMGSTLPEIHVTVCAECHPFYTGKQKLLDSEGRVDRFRRKYGDYQKLGAGKK
jgi:large subunit ribosomal protein L31